MTVEPNRIQDPLLFLFLELKLRDAQIEQLFLRVATLELWMHRVWRALLLADLVILFSILCFISALRSVR